MLTFNSSRKGCFHDGGAFLPLVSSPERFGGIPPTPRMRVPPAAYGCALRCGAHADILIGDRISIIASRCTRAIMRWSRRKYVSLGAPMSCRFCLVMRCALLLMKFPERLRQDAALRV